MPAVQHTAEEEASFLQDLLSGLDDSFWNAVPTPDNSPVKAKPAYKTPYNLVTPEKKKCVASSRAAAKPSGPSPSKVFSAGDASIEAMLEGAEDWDLDMSVDISPVKETKKPKRPQLEKKTSTHGRETCTRCTVRTVSDCEIGGKRAKSLSVEIESGEYRSVILQDDWVATEVHAGDIINVLGNFEPLSQSSSSVTSSITISSKCNLLILHPDLLLTATALSTASQCRRKPLLSALTRSANDVSPALVWGHILHTVVQECLSARRWDDSWIDEKIDEVVRNNLLDLVCINVNVETAVKEVKGRAKGVQTFLGRYMSTMPKSDAVLYNTRASRDQSSLLAISALLDLEEDIWSPKYGLKGKLDATIQTTISESWNTSFSSKPVLTQGPKPLEIKTGRATAGMEHRAQTMLYTLLAQERYGVAVSSGLLYYTQNEEVIQVPASRNELRGLILGRNEMAFYMMRRQSKPQSGRTPEPFLPPTIDDERTCKRCYSLDACMLYRRAIENVEDDSSPIADAYSLKTSHLTTSQCAFFKDWERLLALEEQDVGRLRKELWTMGAVERERHGRCFSSMIIDNSFTPADLNSLGARDGKIHSFTYRFIRAPHSAASVSFLNGFLDKNDPILVSVEPHLLALARGFIVELTPTEVVVGVDHDLSLSVIRSRSADFETSPSLPHDPIIFRIDKDELQGGMGRIRDNLTQLFYVDGDTRRLKLVVDLQRPLFDDSPSLCLPASVSHFSAHLNPNQQQAIDLVLRAHDYALVLGMPGTGKTTLIAAMIQTFVAMGKTVLLTSYTHSAVDTILRKLKDEVDFNILRLGNVDKVHADVRHFTLSDRKRATTVEQLEHQLMTPPVVATTCLSIDNALFSRRTFDYCIVDEASQITLPTCLGPLRFAEKFVLVGDHFQLPPLVRNREARKGGLDVSLFRRLSDAHPHAVVDLAYQYRMNADIMLLSNKLIYHDRLRCGTEAVAQRTLTLPDRSFLSSLHSKDSPCERQKCWLDRLMSEDCRAVFVNTDQIPARDSRVGDLVQNKIEADLVCQITETLLRSGVQPDQIGIISLYRQQIKLLSQQLQGRPGIEFFTVDKSQGRDKECIIISMVRSNSTKTIGDLVKDWRRMNVSFTRARSKLIVIGSRNTLGAASMLSEFLKLMESKDWVLSLPAEAHTLHANAFSFTSNRSKRAADEGAENHYQGDQWSPKKKLKSKVTGDIGLVRGRPILRDLINEAKG